ncbi:hypothetical protein SCUCBS95973_009755 [Sporothrix curviconia]|uniref:Oxidoreductase-like protein n=1 Tax=Sporothrix curviconia TaxID=1260050 RepID=A0ABP0D165_9PEZI
MRAAGAVEAGSLSALNLLAANPPRYPINPTEEPREPLTLYISRVPGTRDVILSTLKPQRKNVTSEDVAHALYYVHLDLPSDELLLAPPPVIPAAAAAAGPPTASLTSSTASPVAAAVSRKPVPGTPATATATASRAELPPSYASATTTATVAALPPPPPPPPPPHTHLPPTPGLASPPRAPQPWVPPGFRLDEHHSFETASSYQDPVPPPVSTTLPIRSRPLPSQAAYNGSGGGSSQMTSPGAPPPGMHMHAPIARKPVGPRTTPQDKALPNPPGAFPSTPTPPGFPTSAAPPQPPPPQQPPQPKRPPLMTTPSSVPSNFVPFQLTLIRRDPSSNHQWNIGKVASVQPTEQPASNPNPGQSQGESPTAAPAHLPLSDDAAPADQPSIRIHLETSGYAKFRGDDDVGRGGAFARQVVMAYTKSWTAGIRNAFKRPSASHHSHERSASDGGADIAAAALFASGGGGGGGGGGVDDVEPPTSRRFLRSRNSSLVSGEESSTGGAGHARPSKELSRDTRDGKDSAPLTRPGPGLKPKGYTFASPWDGRCEFRTGNGGRSLKCRHILHPSTDATTGATGGGVAGYNPLVIAQSIRDGQGLAAVADGRGGGRARATSLSSALSGAAPVSELRFNLPHGEVFRTKAGGSGDEREGASTRGELLYGRFQDHLHQLQARHHRRGSSSTEYEEDADADDGDGDGEMDLSLGRERAGGGNRGKRAKLGKLIVYDDGFKMLDLVVAANMGVWWVSWERSF